MKLKNLLNKSYRTKNSSLALIAVIAIFMLLKHTTYAQNLKNATLLPVTITMDASKTLNKNADQVGIWINTNQDIDNAAMIQGLKDLNIKIIRYGWQGGVFDKNNTDNLELSPKDNANQIWLASNGRLNERFGPQRVAALLSELEIDANVVASVDGINYTGTQDEEISNMTRQGRIDYYANRLVDWVSWNKQEGYRFKYFEIGNESDIDVPLFSGGSGDNWTATDYGNVANQIAIKAKNVDSNVKLGINGGMLGDADVIKWFDAIYAAAPNINDNISFVATHKYEMWLDFASWRDHADWSFGKISSGVLTSCKKHFPTKPIFVTEFGSWKNPEENLAHYRACLNVEMYGNAFTDPQVALIQQWPTKWGDGVFYKNDDYVLTPMGLALKAYTKFSLPVLAANGNRNGIRYFLSTDPTTKAVSIWMVNHLATEQSVTCNILNFNASATNEQWRLTAPGNDPYSTASTLTKDASTTLTSKGTTGTFSTNLPPVSVTIVAFEGIQTSVVDIQNLDKFQLSMFPIPAKNIVNANFALSENSNVSIAILNLLGNTVAREEIGQLISGKHNIKLNVENLADGTYFIQLSANGISTTQKIIKINK